MCQYLDCLESIESKYELFKEQELPNRRFKHTKLIELLDKFKNNSTFNIQQIGESVEKRSIHLVKIGTGKISVLLWSQMHGNESTATRALFDLFHFFASDEFEDFKKEILSKLTLYIIPMLNPDGAERFRRRNAIDIDPNRDALALQSPENRLLKKVRDQINADWGFNLHDQKPWYTAGNTKNPATIAFLAPAYNFAKDINEKRGDAMRMIAFMADFMGKYIPEHIAKYNDDFSARSFGDNMQKWGTRTILIESGGHRNDRERHVARKINFIGLLASFAAIADNSFNKFNIQDYVNIPENVSENIFDLLIRNASLVYENQTFKMDIGIILNEIETQTGFDFQSEILDIGDLSRNFGYHELDATNLTITDKIELSALANFKLYANNTLKYTVENGFLNSNKN